MGKCPKCGGTNIEPAEDVDVEKEIVRIFKYCGDCEHEWIRVYEFQGVEY